MKVIALSAAEEILKLKSQGFSVEIDSDIVICKNEKGLTRVFLIQDMED